MVVNAALLALSSGFLSAPVQPSSSNGFFATPVVRSKRFRTGWPRRSLTHNFFRQKLVAVAVLSTPAFPPRTAEELQDFYGRRGLTFLDLAGMVAANLSLDNGSSARVLLPRALVTSYKPRMWHGGQDEALYTVRNRGERLTASSLRGGIDLRFSQFEDPLSSILPDSDDSWSVEGVKCEPSTHSQIILTNTSNPELGMTRGVKGSLEFRYVVTLTAESLSTALIISNTGPPVDFTGSMVTHLEVSSVEAAFAVGLKGFGYRDLSSSSEHRLKKPPKTSNFFSRLWGSAKADSPGQTTVPNEGSSENKEFSRENEGGLWIVDHEDYSQFHPGEDRLYPTPPSRFTLMDRGFRRSFLLQRHGFDEFSVSNPGPDSNEQDWNTFICIGPTQTSQPVRLGENEEWRAAQTLVNPAGEF